MIFCGHFHFYTVLFNHKFKKFLIWNTNQTDTDIPFRLFRLGKFAGEKCNLSSKSVLSVRGSWFASNDKFSKEHCLLKQTFSTEQTGMKLQERIHLEMGLPSTFLGPRFVNDWYVLFVDGSSGWMFPIYYSVLYIWKQYSPRSSQLLGLTPTNTKESISSKYFFWNYCERNDCQLKDFLQNLAIITFLSPEMFSWTLTPHCWIKIDGTLDTETGQDLSRVGPPNLCCRHRIHFTIWADRELGNSGKVRMEML